MSRPALLATRGSTDSRRAGLVILAAVGLSIAVALGLLVVSGQLKGGGPFASSALVRYGLPLVRAVHDLAAALTVGLLAVGTWCLAPERGAPAGELTGLRLVVIRRAAIAAAVWLAASLTFIVLTAADLSGIRVTDPGFGWLLVTFVGQIDLGRALGVSALLILVVFTFAITATQVTTAAWGAALSLVAVLPIALAGHSAVGSDHMNAVDSLAIHLVGVCLWVGGLARPRIDRAPPRRPAAGRGDALFQPRPLVFRRGRRVRSDQRVAAARVAARAGQRVRVAGPWQDCSTRFARPGRPGAPNPDHPPAARSPAPVSPTRGSRGHGDGSHDRPGRSAQPIGAARLRHRGRPGRTAPRISPATAADGAALCVLLLPGRAVADHCRASRSTVRGGRHSATAPRRQLAVVAAGVLAGWLRAAGADDQRWTGDLRQGPFLHTHAAAHGA